MSTKRKQPPAEEPKEADRSERDRFGRFAKKLVSVPKKEIDEKASEWEQGRARKKTG